MGNDDWYLHYGLDRDPFAEGGVQGLFYPGGGRQETVEQLQHLARFGDSVLVVAGAAGAGKSATLAHFVAQCASDTRCAVVETALLDGPEQLMRRVLAGFGLPAIPDEDLAHALQRLELFCERCREEGMLNWLAFDDAQHLHAEALALLVPLLGQMAGRLRLLFFAEPPWPATLRAALPAPVTIHLIELAPFERGESYAYLHYRMKTAGLESEPPFSAAELEDVHRLSGGLPGRINGLARQLLIDELEVEQRPLAALPLWHLGVVAGTLLLLGGLYVWSLFDERPADEQPRPGVAREIVVEPAPVLLDDKPSVAEDDLAAGSHEAEVADAPDPHDDESASSALPVAVDSMAPAAVAEAPGPPAARGEHATAPTQAPQVADSRPTTPTPPAAPSAAGVGPVAADEEYLLALEGSRYLLQIMASDDLRRVQRFAARQTLPLRQYSKLNGGRRWYALVHGDYPDQASAQRAARELAAQLGGNAPWARRVDAVQREIRAGRAR